jgi:hypothetical protein
MPIARLTVASILLSALAAAAAKAESAPRPFISISSTRVTEGDLGRTAFNVTVSLYGWYQPVTARLVATPGTASAADYDFTETIVALNPGGSAQTVTGYVAGDIEPEGDEYFTITAIPITDSGYWPIYSAGGTVTIEDDDQARASMLHIDSASVVEGDTDSTTIELNVRLEPASSSAVTVKYRTQDGTASEGSDYVGAQGTLMFAPGEVLKTVPITITGDTDWEPHETFTLELYQPYMALIGTSRATVTIANDDPIFHNAGEPTAPIDGGFESCDGGGYEAGIERCTGGRCDGAPEHCGGGRCDGGAPMAFDTSPTVDKVPAYADGGATLPDGASPSGKPRPAHSGCSFIGADAACSTTLLVLVVGLVPYLTRSRRRRA